MSIVTLIVIIFIIFALVFILNIGFIDDSISNVDNLTNINKSYRYLPSCAKFNDNKIWKTTIDKQKMREFLMKHDVPVPKGVLIDMSNFKRSQIKKLLEIKTRDLTFPLVLKPYNGTNGIGVITMITNFNDLYRIVVDLFKTNKRNKLVIEEQKLGNTYRLLFVNGNLVGAKKGYPPYVVGDGMSTIEDLVNELNSNKTQDQIITINPHYLKSMKHSVSDIPRVGERINITNVVTYVTEFLEKYPIEKIHPDNINVFIDLLDGPFQSNCLGIDFISPDISKSYLENGGAVIEFNSNPSRRIHGIHDKNFKKDYMREYRSLKSKYPKRK